MKVTFLGTGTSQGIPLIACSCEVCSSLNSKDKRLRSSVMIEDKSTSVVIDTGPDFRQQMLLNGVKNVDAVIFTHEHKDHIAGFDDIRAFNYIQKKKMDVYANAQVQQAIRREFPYIFYEEKYPGVPEIELHTITDSDFKVGNLNISPINVMHYKMPVLGYRIGSFSYITDANYISDKEKEKITGSEVLVLNALRREKHISHFTLTEAIELAIELKPRKTYLTHISHQLGFHDEVSKELPENIFLAYDGLKIEL